MRFAVTFFLIPIIVIIVINFIMGSRVDSTFFQLDSELAFEGQESK